MIFKESHLTVIVKQNAFLESNPGKLTSIKVEVVFENHVFK